MTETQEKQVQHLTVLCDPEGTQVPTNQVGVGGKTKKRDDSRKQKGKVHLSAPTPQ